MLSNPIEISPQSSSKTLKWSRRIWDWSGKKLKGLLYAKRSSAGFRSTLFATQAIIPLKAELWQELFLLSNHHPPIVPKVWSFPGETKSAFRVSRFCLDTCCTCVHTFKHEQQPMYLKQSRFSWFWTKDNFEDYFLAHLNKARGELFWSFAKCSGVCRVWCQSHI